MSGESQRSNQGWFLERGHSSAGVGWGGVAECVGCWLLEGQKERGKEMREGEVRVPSSKGVGVDRLEGAGGLR